MQLAQEYPPLLQQYLRLLLLPQLCERDAVIAREMWGVFSNSLSCLCLNDSSSSGLGSMVTEVTGSGSMAAVGSREQQQLLGLLMSYVKAMLLLMQQPASVSADAAQAQQQQQQHAGGTACIEVLVECGKGLASVTTVAVRMLHEQELQSSGGVAATWQPERNGNYVPWLLLLACAMFASAELLSALAVYAVPDTHKAPDKAGAGGASGTAAAAADMAAIETVMTDTAQRQQLAQNINTTLRTCVAATYVLRGVLLCAFAEQESVAGSSSEDSIQQSLLQLAAFVDDFAAAAELVGRVAGVAAAAEGTPAEHSRLVSAPLNVNEMLWRCVQDMGLSREPRTAGEQYRLDAESTLEQCCLNVQTSLADLHQRVAPLAQKLQQWAAGFCGQFALACCCNNASCINMLMPSEQELVGGKQCVCAGCRCARFCSKECQAEMWPHHKQLCKKLKRQQQGEGRSEDTLATTI
jgi:hypothetical protein